MSRMPEHDVSVAGHRSALLMKFSESGSTGPGGLWTPSMHGNLCAGASTTSGLLQLSSCKIDINNKSSQQQGTTAAGQRSQAKVTTLSPVPARMSSTSDQGGAGGGRGGGEVVDVRPPTPIRQVGGRSPKISTKRNGRRNPSLSMGKGSATSTELLSVEAVKQRVRDCRKEAKKLAASSTTSVKTEGVGLSLTEKANRRGVRKRPGVKGYLVEIRPKRWKKTIWLGTYNTEVEACRAYDAGIFYTKKPMPFHYPDSLGSFPDLPSHLSLRMDEDPTKLEEVKQFIKAQALKASKRSIDAVTVDSLECSLDSSTYSDAGSNSSSRSEKVAKTTQSSCCPVTAKEEEQEEEQEQEQEQEDKEDEEEEEEEQVDIQIQTPNTEEVIKHLDSLVHLCTGEEGGLSSSQDKMGEGSISAEEKNLDTMTKDSESSLHKLWDDEHMLVSPGSHVEGAMPVDDRSIFKHCPPELIQQIYYDTKGKSNIKFEKLWVPSFSMDLSEIMTQDWYMKSNISHNLDTQIYRDDGNDVIELWDLRNVGKIMWQGRDLLKAWLRPFSLDCICCLQVKWFP